MPNVKNQHYVPQCYLRNFTIEAEKLFAFDKLSKISFLTNVKNIASETYFHEVKPEIIARLKNYIAIRVANNTQNIDDIEKIFSQIDNLRNTEDSLSERESEFKITIDAVLDWIKTKAEINSEHRDKIAYFMALQFIRTVAFRRDMIESMQIIHKGWLDAIFEIHKEQYDSSDIEVSLDDDMVSLVHVSYLNDAETIDKVTQIFKNHIWYIGFNNTEQPFFSSDNPIIKIACGESLGLGSKGIQIAYPLSPNYIIILLERKFFAEFKVLNNKVVPFDSERVTFYNELQVWQSRRQIYSPTDVFQVAKEICLNNPEICPPKRSNMTIKRIKPISK